MPASGIKEITMKNESLPNPPQPAADEGVQTVAALLFDKIRADIIRGELAPGQKLKVAELAARYEAGAIPIREALSRLATSGFVEARNQRGFAVRDVSAAELLDLTRVRLFIETAALREAIQYGDLAWEQGVRAAYERLMQLRPFKEEGNPRFDLEWEAAHDAFHKQLIAGCTSPWLLKFSDELRDQMTRYRHISARSRHTTVRDVKNEHSAITDAVLARKEELAVALLHEHISTSTSIALTEGVGFSSASASRRKLSGTLPPPGASILDSSVRRPVAQKDA